MLGGVRFGWQGAGTGDGESPTPRRIESRGAKKVVVNPK